MKGLVMRRLIYLLLVVSLVLPSCGSVDQAWLSGVQAGVDVIVPEYLEYVAADEKLTDAEKATRKRTAELLVKSIESARKE